MQPMRALRRWGAFFLSPVLFMQPLKHYKLACFLDFLWLGNIVDIEFFIITVKFQSFFCYAFGGSIAVVFFWVDVLLTVNAFRCVWNWSTSESIRVLSLNWLITSSIVIWCCVIIFSSSHGKYEVISDITDSYRVKQVSPIRKTEKGIIKKRILSIEGDLTSKSPNFENINLGDNFLQW